MAGHSTHPALTFSLALLAACSTTPPPEDDPLRADPPLVEPDPATKKGNPELDRGVAYVKNGKFAEALPHLKAALEVEPKNALALATLGLVTEQTGGDRKEAERLYKEALAIDPQLPDAAQNLAAMYLEDPARPDDAIPLLTSALKVNVGDPTLLANLGYAHTLKKEYDAAEKAYASSLAKKDDTQTRLALGLMLVEAKKGEAAVPHLLKVAESVKDDAPMLFTLGRNLLFGKAWADCVKVLDRGLAIKQHPEALARRGMCKHELKLEKEASKDFEAATKLDPKYQAAFFYLGQSLLLQKNKPGAKVAFRKAYEIDKTSDIGKSAKAKLDSP